MTGQGSRPRGLYKPAGEWLLMAVLAIALPTGLGDDAPWWLTWGLRAAGVAAAAWFIGGRIRYRRRRGEGIWLWDRI